MTIKSKQQVILCGTILSILHEDGVVPTERMFAAFDGIADLKDFEAAVGLLVKIGKIRKRGTLLDLVR